MSMNKEQYFLMSYLSENDCSIKMDKKPGSPLCVGKCPDNKWRKRIRILIRKMLVTRITEVY